MGRLGLAFKLLFNRDLYARVAAFLATAPTHAGAERREQRDPSAAPDRSPAPTRSEALTLLSVLQREARLIDFLKEDITAYADAQIGAAVRDVHRDARAALDRLFALKPVLEQPEGSDVSLSPSTDAARIRLVGNPNPAATKGRLQHAGWQASKVELPQYTGTTSAANIIAPAEVEV